jgi:hypothetical protein
MSVSKWVIAAERAALFVQFQSLEENDRREL